ncbi:MULTISPECIES: hypothetical protein [unclassified Microcoleus]|uniref:hypothetical protein n=1 Tax=unclassified Microcoleus TaxID=2642155 RepID=UPI002FCF1B8A
MTFLKISIPVYKKDKWERLEKDGKLEVSSEVDSLSDAYEMLKQQLDNLLAELDAQNRLAEDSESLERQIQQKAYTLKTLTKDIERATEHYESLKLFLERLGIDPTAYQLTFDKRFLLQDASLSEVEIVPPEPRYPDGVI